MRVVAFTGMPGAGKSVAVEEARRHDWPIVSMGDFVREETRSRNLPPTDENLGRVASEMRRLHGADYWARRTANHIQESWKGHEVVVIDGVRTLDEIRHFRARLGTSFHLIAVDVPPATRMERLKQRGRADDPREAHELARRDEREIRWGILEAIASADTVIQNNPPVEDFRRRVADVLEKLTRAD